MVVAPAEAGAQAVYVIARETRDSMQSLDAGFRRHDDMYFQSSPTEYLHKDLWLARPGQNA